MAKKLRIVSRTEGFRRCGVTHTAAATFHELDTFSKKDRAILEAEPVLICDVVDGKDDDKPDAKKDTSDNKK